IALSAANTAGDASKNKMHRRRKFMKVSSREPGRPWPPRARYLPRSFLLAGGGTRAPVARPAGFVRFGTLRTLFPVANSFQTVGRYSQLHQEVLCRARPAIPQAEIVLRRTTFVAMALHHDRSVRKIRQNALDRGGIPRQSVARIAADVA